MSHNIPYPENLIRVILYERVLPDSMVLNKDRIKGVEYALGTLTERQQMILKKRYADKMTLVKLANEIGMTESRISAIEHKAIRDLRCPSRLKYIVDGYAAASGEIENCFAKVVLCKHCIYWGDEDGIRATDDGTRYARCRMHNVEIPGGQHVGWCPKESDYCSLGERKENSNGDKNN